MSKKRKKMLAKRAAHMPTWMQTYAMMGKDNIKQSKWRKYRRGLGTHGPASEVRTVDPKDYEGQASQ
jgi:hypothetical protein